MARDDRFKGLPPDGVWPRAAIRDRRPALDGAGSLFGNPVTNEVDFSKADFQHETGRGMAERLDQRIEFTRPVAGGQRTHRVALVRAGAHFERARPAERPGTVVA
jgi:hypothetical protein